MKCAQYDRQLQRSNTKVKFLENHIRALELKIEFMLLESKKSKLKTQPTHEKCKLCYKQLTGREVEEHLCIEHRNFIQCPYCLLAFITTKDFLSHIKAHKLSLAADRKQKSYKCHICSITYTMQTLLDCHKMSHAVGHVGYGIPFDPVFERLAIIKPEELNQSNNLKQTTEPNRTHFVTAPSLPYKNLISDLNDVKQNCKKLLF